MDVAQLQPVVTIDDFTREHIRWLFAMLPVIYAALAGALIRLLLIRGEPFWVRSQNAAAGLLIALILSGSTAQFLTGGDYVAGYAAIYGMVGREIFAALYDFSNENIKPLLMSALRHFFPFLFKDQKEDGHDPD